VEQSKTFSSRLNDISKENNKNWIFINGGIGNYNTERYVNNYFENWINLEVTDIIINFFVNDTESLVNKNTNFFVKNSHFAVVVWKLINSYKSNLSKENLVSYYEKLYEENFIGYQTAKENLIKLNKYCKIKKINCYFQNELKKIDYKQKRWILTFTDRQKKIYEKLILTCPFPQLLKLSKKFIKDPFINKKVRMDANITVMIVIKKTNKNISSYFFDDKILGWAANENSKKRFKSSLDLWTLQSTYNWANKKINKNRENKDLNSKVLIDKFFKLTGIKKTKTLFSLNHGWKYSSNSKPLNIKSYWNSALNLGVCADWFVGPRLEAGWISANDLYKKIKK